MEAHNFCPGKDKTKKVVDYEDVKRLQEEGLPAHRRSIESFALLVAQGLLNNFYAKLGPFRIDLISRVFQIPKKTVNALFAFYVCYDRTVPDALRIRQSDLPMLSATLFQSLSALPPERCLSLLPAYRRSFSCRPTG